MLQYSKPNNSIKDRGAVNISIGDREGSRKARLRERESRRRHQAKDVLGDGDNTPATVATNAECYYNCLYIKVRLTFKPFYTRRRVGCFIFNFAKCED